MTNRHSTGRRIKLASLLISLFIFTAVLFAILALGIGADTVVSDRRAFGSADEQTLEKDLASTPKTFEALFYAPTAEGGYHRGVFFGNGSSEGPYINFQTVWSGIPSIWIKDPEGNRIDINFEGVDVRCDGWVHLVITHEVKESGGADFTCYVNGEAKKTVSTDLSYDIDPELLQLETSFMLGRDMNWRNEHYFRHNVKHVALYSKALTADEVKASYDSGAANVSGLMAYYDLTKSSNQGESVSDSTGNGYNFTSAFYSREKAVGDYDYSFAVVGDTQCLVEYDTENSGKETTNAIYDWLVANKDKKNIKYVLGLGDVTQDDLDTEWTTAKNQIAKLNAVGMPYSLINGNHDSVPQLDKYFAEDANFTSQEIGYYSGTSLGNYYVKFEVGGTKYMVMALQFPYTQKIIEWANNVVASNAQYNVIITTHAYVDFDGTLLEEGDAGTQSHYNASNMDADYMWDYLVSQNKNIKLVFSGHIAADNIVRRESVGVHGNTVHEMLINPQAMDHAFMYNTGMVAMLYFSNGGKDVAVEYVSTARSLAAIEADANAEDVLYNTRNQFKISLDEPRAEDKGEIDLWLVGGQSNAVGYANNIVPEHYSDSRYFEGFENVLYYGYGEKWVNGFDLVRYGVGRPGSKHAGVEIGIAEALGNTGGMHAVIKYAQGATFLAPDTASKYSVAYGTWTSPSYIKDKNVVTDGTKTGLLYTNFINTVESACAELREMGYTPVVRGMWWMQGEAECGNVNNANAYGELLTYLIGDVRRDVGAIVGQDLSNMPFVFGKIYDNPNVEGVPAYIENVRQQQENVAKGSTGVANAFIVDPGAFSGIAQHDNWHFDAKTQAYLGKSFVAKTLGALGLYKVTGYGINATLSGGGLYKNGSSIEVTVGALPGYTVSAVNMIVDGVSTPLALIEGKATLNIEGKDINLEILTAGGEAEVTKYGTIPAEYSKEGYPFAVFSGGSFVSAHTFWGDAVKAAYNILRGTAGAGKDAEILLRRDYSTNFKDASSAYFAHMNGSFTFDLGGNTMVRTKEGYLFDLVAQLTDGALFKTSIKLINGTVVYTSSPLIGLNHNTSSSLEGSLKTVDFSFEDVTFAIDPVSICNSGVITACWENGNTGANVNMTFTNCTFDLTEAPSHTVMLNFAGASKSLTYVNATFIGGKIIAGNKAVVFTKTDAGDSVTYAKNSSDKYMALEVPTGADMSGFEGYLLSDTGKELKYVLVESGKYELAETGNIFVVHTEYGDIPGTYSDPSANPFALFGANKNFLGAYADIGAALDAARALGTSADYFILMRADTSASTVASNVRDFRGTVTIDLGDFELNSGTANYILNIFVYNNGSVTLTDGYDRRTTWVIKNGTYRETGNTYAFACVNYGELSTKPVLYNFLFDDVTFKSDGSHKDASGVIFHTWEDKFELEATSTTTVNATFNNCVFDMVNCIDTGVMIQMIRPDKPTWDKLIYNVTVSGGKLLINSISDMSSFYTANDNANGRADSIVFSEGSYMKLYAPAGFNMQGAEMYLATDTSKTVKYVYSATEGGYDVYVLEESELPTAVETQYGTIPAEYASVASFPFALFYGDKTFVGAYADYGNAVNAMLKSPTKDYVLLMRRDAGHSVGTTGHAALTGNITVDLGGFTLTNNTGYLFDIFVNNNSSGLTSDKRGTFLIKNGKIDDKGTAVACINYGTLNSPAECTMNFEGVTFRGTGGNTAVVFITWDNNGTGSSTGKNFTAYSTFTDCVFDYSQSQAGTVMFKLHFNDKAFMDFVIDIKGGKIISNTAPAFSSLYDKNDDDKVEISRNDNGDYVSVVVPSSVGKPEQTWTSKSGAELVFTEGATDLGMTEYTLIPKAISDFNVKSSVSLENELVYNIYIPVSDIISSVKLGRESVDLSTLDKDTKDGVLCYKIAASLNAYESLDSISLEIALTADGEDYLGNYTFSVFDYSKDIVDGEYTESEKTLARDLLSYVRAAYLYFGKNADIITDINELLGEGYDESSLPNMVEEAKTPEAGSGFTGVTLYLGDCTALRFYLAEGVSADAYTFAIGEYTIEAILGSDTNGSFIEIELAACLALSDINYTANGVTYTYNVYSYYQWAKASGLTEEAALIERLVKYCESAAAYTAAPIE
ncbi:MAG: metallophosphoesterase [Clostridia bacterium]|nr:metallophosphoesterase [Clostridia bacterium]